MGFHVGCEDAKTSVGAGGVGKFNAYAVLPR